MKGKVKKVLILIVSVIFIFNNISINAIAGSKLDIGTSGKNSNIYIPEVVELNVNKAEYKPGDILEVEAKVDEKESKVNNISIHCKPQSIIEGAEDIIVDLRYDSKSQTYKGNIKITSDMASDEWRVGIIIIETTDNQLHSSWSPFDVGFRIAGTNLYVPKVEYVLFDKEEIKAGEEIGVKVKIDSPMKMLGVTPVVDKPESILFQIGENLIYNSNTDLFEGRIKLDKKSPSGNYSIQSINGFTNESSQINIDISQAKNNTLKVIGNSNIDCTKPVLKSVNVDKKYVSAGDKIKISIDAEDKESGLRYVGVCFKFPFEDEESSLELELKYNEATGLYENIIDVTDYFKSGDWELQYVMLCNNETNKFINSDNFYERQDFDFKNGDFNVETNTIVDNNLPLIKEVMFSSEKVCYGDKFKIYLTVEELDSGIASISINKQPGAESYMHGNFIYNKELNRYEGEMIIPDKLVASLGGVPLMINVSDYAGNYAGYAYRMPIQSYDINADRDIDVLDLSLIAKAYNVSPNNTKWNEKYDMNFDKIIDLFDLVKLAKQL